MNVLESLRANPTLLQSVAMGAAGLLIMALPEKIRIVIGVVLVLALAVVFLLPLPKKESV